MKLTARRRQLLEAIIAYIEEHHVPPTWRELRTRYGASLTAVQEQLKALERLGYLRLGANGKFRQIVVQKYPDGEPYVQVTRRQPDELHEGARPIGIGPPGVGIGFTHRDELIARLTSALSLARSPSCDHLRLLGLLEEAKHHILTTL